MPPTPAAPSASEPSLELRRARPDQLEEVGRLTVAAYADLVPAEDAYTGRLGDAAARAAEAELWVAERDGALLGSVTFCPAGSAWREIAREDEGEFRMLGVAPAARGQGVGRALVELCVRRSRVLGFDGLRMSTMATMTSAHRIYERVGFTRAPEDDWSPVPGVDLLAYALRF